MDGRMEHRRCRGGGAAAHVPVLQSGRDRPVISVRQHSRRSLFLLAGCSAVDVGGLRVWALRTC